MDRKKKRELTTDEIDLIIIKASEQVRKEQPLKPAPKYVSDLTLRTVFGYDAAVANTDAARVVEDPNDDT